MSREEKRKTEGKRAKHEKIDYTANKKSNNNRKINEKKPKIKKKKGKALKIVLTILITLLVLIVAVFGTYLYKSGGNIKGAVMNMVKDVVGDQDPIFVLVLGVSEDISVELTDTIMLAGYNPDTNQAFLLSIPRDTFVGKNESTAGGYDKINALYQTNPEKTVTAVENLTGINIDYYVTVKTSVLVDIVDTIGGVEYDVPIKMDYDDPTQNLHIHLKPGMQTLNGKQAEQLVRFRHNNNGTTYSAEYGDNDEGRMRTQREFLKVLAQQVIQTKDVDQIKQVITTIFDNLETNITLSEILGYVPYAIEFNINDLQMEQLPGTPAKLNDLWFYKADMSETKELINQYIEKLGLTESEKKQYTKAQVTTNKSTTTTTKKDNTKKNTTTNNTVTNNTVTNKTTNTVTNKTTNTVNNTTNKNTVTNNNVVKNEVVNETVTTNTINKNNTTNNTTNTTTNNTTNENTTNKNDESNKDDTSNKNEDTNKDNDTNKGDNESSNDSTTENGASSSGTSDKTTSETTE